MQTLQAVIGKETLSAGIHEPTCPFESESGYFCHASVMTVVMSSHQKKAHCWTDNYSGCPMFLAKILRDGNQGHFIE